MDTVCAAALSLLEQTGLSQSGADHSGQFQALTKRLLIAFTTASIISVTSQEIEWIACLSILHDIGKRAIPSSLLNKPGRLTQEEFEIIKTHTLHGCRLLDDLPEFRNSRAYSYAYHICRHHHECGDGLGYPDGLRGEEITPWVQAVALADVYDALTSPRPYKPAYLHALAVSMIAEGQCGHFAPAISECFCREISGIHSALPARSPENRR